MLRKFLGGGPLSLAGTDGSQKKDEALPPNQSEGNGDVEAGSGVPSGLSGGSSGAAERGPGSGPRLPRPTGVARKKSPILWFALAIFGIVMMAQLLTFTIHSRRRERFHREVGSRHSIRGETVAAIQGALSLNTRVKRSAAHPVELWKDFIVTLESAVKVARKQPLAVLIEESAVMLRSTLATAEAGLCRAVGWNPIAGAQRGNFVLIGQAKSLTTGLDEFGTPSPFVSLATITGMLARAQAFEGRDNKDLVVINMGARDGKGTTGKNEDPTYELFKAGYGGAAIEPNDAYRPALIANLARAFGIEPIIVMPTPENIIDVIRPRTRIDVLRVDLDSYDCDIIPVLLEHYHPQVIHVEYNAKFPPPLLVKLRYSPSFNAGLRGHVYQCSLSWMTHMVMRPKGYRLAQVDWQSAIYVDQAHTSALSLPADGVSDVDAYEKGYQLREGRFMHYWWTIDLEHLLFAASPQALLHQTRVWLMDNQDVCATKYTECIEGIVVLGLDCASLEMVGFQILSNPGQYGEAALMSIGEQTAFLGPEEGGGRGYGANLLARVGLSGTGGKPGSSDAGAGDTVGPSSSRSGDESPGRGAGGSSAGARRGGASGESREDLLAGRSSQGRAARVSGAVKGVAPAAPGLEKLV